MYNSAHKIFLLLSMSVFHFCGISTYTFKLNWSSLSLIKTAKIIQIGPDLAKVLSKVNRAPHCIIAYCLDCPEPLILPPLPPVTVSPPQSEARLTCEFCGKRDFIHKFARSRRFCSVTCSKRFSAYSMRKAPDGSVTGRPTSLSTKNSRPRGSSGQVC